MRALFSYMEVGMKSLLYALFSVCILYEACLSKAVAKTELVKKGAETRLAAWDCWGIYCSRSICVELENGPIANLAELGSTSRASGGSRKIWMNTPASTVWRKAGSCMLPLPSLSLRSPTMFMQRLPTI